MSGCAVFVRIGRGRGCGASCPFRGLVGWVERGGWPLGRREWRGRGAHRGDLVGEGVWLVGVGGFAGVGTVAIVVGVGLVSILVVVAHRTVAVDGLAGDHIEDWTSDMIVAAGIAD